MHWYIGRASISTDTIPITFTKPLGAEWGNAMAANGDDLLIANANPGTIMMYDIKSGRTTTLKDDYGYPYDMCDTPYAIKTLIKNPSLGINEPRYESIPYAGAVEWAKPI